METLWFILLAFMLSVYVLLDGFDIGSGIVHLIVARNDHDRRTVLGSIGPFWDGNEVWLLAAGGVLYLAFPVIYAASFSGFYLPLIIVLWLLIMRGLGIEFRHQFPHPLWKSFWDASFSVSSVLLAVFLGAALGNVLRGVPLGKDGYFFEPLWTTFTVVPESGVLDWFTVTMGLVSLFTLTMHGAAFLALKTEGEVQKRARVIAGRAWFGTVITSGIALAGISSIRPSIWTNFGEYPLGFAFPALGVFGLFAMSYYTQRTNDTLAFVSSSCFILGILASTAFCIYPTVLPSSIDPAYSLTVHNAAAKEYGLSVALVWWILGMILASGYFLFVYRAFRGKVAVHTEDEGY